MPGSASGLGYRVPGRGQSSLTPRLEKRSRIEEEFERMRHTYRHSRIYTLFERYIVRPSLRLALQLSGLYRRGQRNALAPIVRRFELPFEELPPAWDGFTILHISDLHIEGTPGLVDALAKVISPLRPDVCFLTGDYRFESLGSSAGVYGPMRQLLSSIHARLGTVGVMGNHDSAEIAPKLEEMGVRMLINEAIPLGSGDDAPWVAGVDDPFDYACHDLQEALKQVPPQAFTILLAHAPEIYKEAASAGIKLYLTGHTHAGQIRFPLVGPLKQNARCPKAFGFGLWKHRGMQGYTTAGAGCSSLPVRYNCPPEVVLFTLRHSS